MRVTMLLCDAAQVAEGKLFILGGGWSIASASLAPSAVALKFEVDWDEANRPHHWELFLVDEDGQAVTWETTEGDAPVEVRGDFEVGRPAGLPQGASLDLPLAVSVPPLQLKPDCRFVWRLTVDGESSDAWMVAFTTTSAQTS
jgi:hypothetical protein